uniref:Desacetoxyvindoline 4-hydroxylase n=1 Tax=Rhizophora mucronata TaxID=61149 RepID=A0A2P2N3W5_RHIMU
MRKKKRQNTTFAQLTIAKLQRFMSTTATAFMASRSGSGQGYDPLEEVEQSDDSKTGVKGLVDSGVSTIPRSSFTHLKCSPISNPEQGQNPTASSYLSLNSPALTRAGGRRLWSRSRVPPGNWGSSKL